MSLMNCMGIFRTLVSVVWQFAFCWMLIIPHLRRVQVFFCIFWPALISFRILYVFFRIIPWCLNFICRRFGTLRLFRLPAYGDGTDSVPKRRHIKFRHQGITRKKAYNIQNMAKVWSQELFRIVLLFTYCSSNMGVLKPCFLLQILL